MEAGKKDIHRFLNELIRTLVSVIEEKDVYMRGHAERVAENCSNFCNQLDCAEKENLEKIYYAGLFHDIGMVYLPNGIIQKEGKLSRDEMIMVKQHPVISEKILSNVTFLKDILPTVRHHHEAFDGTGYPDGLKGDEIPLGARILNLFSSYDAMTSARPFRTAMSMEKALEEIYGKSGNQFDSNLANAFLEFIEKTVPTPGDAIKSQIPKQKGEGKEEEDASFHAVFKGIIAKFNSGKLDLPVLPQIYQEVKKVLEDENATANDLAKVVEKDAVISVRLLALVNSPYYRGLNEIDTVRSAISRLGENQVDKLVSAIANKSLYQTKSPLFRRLFENLWLHSLACAYGSRAIAKKLELGSIEIFFLMGLMHDIGKVLLIKALSEMPSLKLLLRKQDITESVQQYHCVFGESVLQRWGFNKVFIEAAKFHEGDVFSPSTEKGILVVNLSNYLTRNIGYSLFDEEVDLSALKSRELLGMDVEDLNIIGNNIQKAMMGSAHYF